MSTSLCSQQVKRLGLMLSHPSVNALRASEAAKYDAEYFKHHYWREDLPGLSGNRGLSYDDPEHAERFRFLFDCLVGAEAPRSLLDAGAAQGHMLDRALRNGVDAVGIDVSPAAKQDFQIRRPELDSSRFIICSMTRLPFSDSAFDLVLCLDVLEHLIVFDLFDAVMELARVTSRRLICSINLDNPYKFHPSILSENTWCALFASTGLVQYNESASRALNETVTARFCEYSMFVFDKI